MCASGEPTAGVDLALEATLTQRFGRGEKIHVRTSRASSVQLKTPEFR